MAVQDIVQQFESSSSSSESLWTSASGRRHSASPVNSSTSTPRMDLPLSPARFLHHPLLKRQSVLVPRTKDTRHTHTQVSLENSQADGGPNVPRRDETGQEIRRTTLRDGKNERRPTNRVPLQITPGPGGHVSVESHAKWKNAEETDRVGAINTLQRMRPSPSHSFGNVSQSITGTPVNNWRPDPNHNVTYSVIEPSVSSPLSSNHSDASTSIRPQIAQCEVDGTPMTSHIWELPMSPSNRGTGVVRMNTEANAETDVKSAPPAYSTSQSGPSTSSFHTSSQAWLSQTLNDIPLDTYSRSTHDYNDLATSRPPSPSATLVSQPLSNSQAPVAAKTVFSRGSAPLSLPALDNYLSSSPPPAFSSFSSHSSSSHGKQPEMTLFPPMDLLAASGHSIEELEKNSVVPSSWRNRGSIFNSLAYVTVGVMGSSAIAHYYSLQGLYDGLQIFALLLSTIVPSSGTHQSDKWSQLFLGTIPNVLALNLGHTMVASLILLIVFMTLSGFLLYYFHVSTKRIALASTREGFQGKDTGAGWGIIFASFFLTLVYLPLSTLVVHVLLWSQDLWVVPNPYINATFLPPSLPPLGPPSQFRDPLDFCYTTTMSKNQINFAPMLIILAILTFILLTVWFPIRLARVIKDAAPRVDRYTELGMRRSQVELNHEYERLLERDKSPFSFLYNDLRMGWGTYKASYLFVKLSTLLIIAVLDPNNCLFRNASRNTVSLVRQIILVFAMSGFLLIQSLLSPFLDPVYNASEWVSRVGYVTFAVLGLVTTLKIPMGVKAALSGPVLYIIYIIYYGSTFYFLLINLGWTRRLVKKLSRRIDFSIDIFSPSLDISNNSRHTRRRIWQESITALLLTSHKCAIPKSQQMEFSESQGSQWPPYLLKFQGTPAERHVENLKILREMGGLEYAKGVALHKGRHSDRMKYVQEKIQRHFIGPDSYWRTPSVSGTCFGNAWWIPFPPTLVIHYDSGELVVLNKLHQLEEYIHQNDDMAVQEKRSIRMTLRALDGLVVTWPHMHTQRVGARHSWCCGRRYTAQTSMDYESCVFTIERRGSLIWKGIQLGSGFNVQLTYTRDVQVDGTVIGLDDDFDLTPQLARFLTLNRKLIHHRFPQIDSTIRDYRRQMRRNARAKSEALTYEFLSTIYCSPMDPDHLTKQLQEQETDVRVRQTFLEHEDALRAAYERMTAVNRSQVATWWYLYWDDLWRRNHETIVALNIHAPDFNPHYPTSIAYRPLPRAALEGFLGQRGLFCKNGGRADVIHSGVLNKLYFRLNQIVFRGSEKAITYRLGDDAFEVDLEELEFSSHTKSSSLGTGGGTDHDDVSIRPRPFYRWEAIFEDPLRRVTKRRYRRWLPKLAVWFGLSPFWKPNMALTSGVSLDVRLEDGRYVLLDNAVDELKEKVV